MQIACEHLEFQKKKLKKKNTMYFDSDSSHKLIKYINRKNFVN